MHEGAVCTEMMEIVENAAVRSGLKRVAEILMSVGPYSCLNPEQLDFYFQVANRGTCMENAVIRMERDESLTGITQMYIKSIRGE